MKRMTSNQEAMQVALLTVHVEAETAEQIGRVSMDMPWASAPVNFDNYFDAERRPHLTQQAISSDACIALVDFDGNPALAARTTEFLTQSFFRKIAVVGLSSDAAPDLLLRAMRAGCNEFLYKPFDASQFRDLLTRLEQRWSALDAQPQNSGKILAFFGSKGGVGATTLAVHLAVYLVKVSGKKVLLVDNRSQLGHVCLYLGLDGNRHHFHELVRNVNRLDHDLLRGFIAKHPSGLDVLASPDVHGSNQISDGDAVERTLSFLSASYDFVVLDCQASFEEPQLAALDIASHVYLVSTPEIGAIRDLSRYVDGLIQNEQAADKLQVVINRYSTGQMVSIEQIEKAIRLPVAVKIANSYAEILRSINTGEPAPPDGKSPFSSQMTKWASTLAGVTAAAAGAKKRFSLWN
jgi:pilus assembly protein CpaE